MIAPGTAVAADRRKRLFVRNCGAQDIRDTSNARLFLRWSVAAQNWSPVGSYARFFDNECPVYTSGGAVVARDSLFYSAGGPAGRLLRWNTKQDKWSWTRPPPPLAEQTGSAKTSLPALCWDGKDALYVVGPGQLLCYSITGDSWTEAEASDSSILSRLPQFGSPALVDGRLYAVLHDGQFRALQLSADAWESLPAIPTANPVTICCLAGDPGCGILYALTDAIGLHNAFLAYDIANRCWRNDLVQPNWDDEVVALNPGATLVRGGPYLFAFNGNDNDLHIYNLPPLRDRRRD
jgi:hypothetical protein